jgi:hypothetical protein
VLRRVAPRFSAIAKQWLLTCPSCRVAHLPILCSREYCSKFWNDWPPHQYNYRRSRPSMPRAKLLTASKGMVRRGGRHAPTHGSPAGTPAGCLDSHRQSATCSPRWFSTSTVCRALPGQVRRHHVTHRSLPEIRPVGTGPRDGDRVGLECALSDTKPVQPVRSTSSQYHATFHFPVGDPEASRGRSVNEREGNDNGPLVYSERASNVGAQLGRNPFRRRGLIVLAVHTPVPGDLDFCPIFRDPP